MPSSFATTCWPKQFLAKWLAVLFGAFIVGVLISAYFHPKVAPHDVQANVKIFVQFGSQTPKPTMADVSYVDGPSGNWDSSKVFHVGTGGAQKSFLGGRTTYFKVWPKRLVKGKVQYEGDQYYLPIPWPDKPHQTVTLKVVRNYLLPNWHF